VIPNTCPNLSNIVHTDFELGRVIQTVTAADPGITAEDAIKELQDIKFEPAAGMIGYTTLGQGSYSSDDKNKTIAFTP